MNPQMTMIERVAKAIYDAEAERSPISAASFDEMQVLSPDKYSYWCGVAKIAIEAMREPTEAMVKVVPYDMYDPDFEENWRIMIDAALDEEANK